MNQKRRKLSSIVRKHSTTFSVEDDRSTSQIFSNCFSSVYKVEMLSYLVDTNRSIRVMDTVTIKEPDDSGRLNELDVG